MAKIFLLADDDFDDMDIFSEALTEIDPSIVLYKTYNGREVLKHLEDKTILNPDIIFLDVNMPIMDGWTCLTEIKKSGKYADIPVIIYSTAINQKEINTALDLGAICLFSKPVDFKLLTSVLKAIADNLGENLINAIKSIKGVNCNKLSALPKLR